MEGGKELARPIKERAELNDDQMPRSGNHPV